MTNKTCCDICGEGVESYALVPLLDSYATKDISHLCSKCADSANKHVWKIKALNHSWCSKMLKIWMRSKRKSFVYARK